MKLWQTKTNDQVDQILATLVYKNASILLPNLPLDNALDASSFQGCSCLKHGQESLGDYRSEEWAVLISYF